eukprot:1154534-Pelagomonas_calceolata.AAC.6
MYCQSCKDRLHFAALKFLRKGPEDLENCPGGMTFLRATQYKLSGSALLFTVYARASIVLNHTA